MATGKTWNLSDKPIYLTIFYSSTEHVADPGLVADKGICHRLIEIHRLPVERGNLQNRGIF